MNKLTSKQPASLLGVELEREQLRLVRCNILCKHEQVIEYVLFLGEFHRYLDNIPKKWGSGVCKWLPILSEYSKLIGFPRSFSGWAKIGVDTKSKGSLMHALRGAIAYFEVKLTELKGENNVV